MLDLFYETEKPIPANREVLYEVLRAPKVSQRSAIDFILKKYWKKLGGGRGGNLRGYVNPKAAQELANYRSNIANAVKAGKQSALARNVRSTDAQRAFNYLNPELKQEEEGRSPNHKLSQDHAVKGRPNGPKIPPPERRIESEKERRTREAGERLIRKAGGTVDD